MDAQLDYISNLDNNDKMHYIGIVIFILYICTSVINTQLSHILAFFLVVFVVYTVSYFSNKKIVSDIKTIHYKLHDLLDFRESLFEKKTTNISSFPELNIRGYNEPPEYMYMDSDLVEIFYDIKYSFSEYNLLAYLKALFACNILLGIVYDFQRQIESPPKPPFVQDNYLDNYNVEHSNDFEKTLINGYENYQLAEQNVKNSLNHIQSLIVSIPSDPMIHVKHKEILEKLEILLRRNLDVIYKIYKKRKKDSDPVITDYDNTKPYNSFTGNTQIQTNFNFF